MAPVREPRTGAVFTSVSRNLNHSGETMKVFVQNNRCPSQVLFAFDEVANITVNQVRWAMAYSTRSGCERLVKYVSARIGQRTWEATSKHFVTSLDFGLTEPSALEFLANQAASNVYIANASLATSTSLMPARAYHPKLYLFDTPNRTGFVVGSANLTNSALISNTEVVMAGTDQPQNSWNDLWTELVHETTPLTSDILEAYRRRWVRPQGRTVEPEPQPAPPVIRPTAQPVFWDAVSANRIDPMAFNQFWVEAGSMSSGGSHNQLEMPRGANRFFGFRHTRYGDAHLIIGFPALTLRGQTWGDRPLTWHGNNRMERINLPTRTQGGFRYENTVVLFRRHNRGFEINAVPWNDEETIAWRAASAALDTIFRLGERGARICGLF